MGSLASEYGGGTAYWAAPASDLMAEYGTRATGLSSADARERLQRYGRNSVTRGERFLALSVLVRQFRSPLILILVFAAGMSALVGERTDALIIILIVLVSCALSFVQEYRASRAVEALRRRIAQKATVLRDGGPSVISALDVVPGDIVRLSAGNLVPADGIILEARDFNVSEAVLTGEAFPVSKSPGTVDPGTSLSGRSNSVFTGSSVRSGTASVVVIRTGDATEFAAIASAVARRSPETEFARGIRRFGYLMTEIMLVIVILVFFANLLLQREPIDSLLFSIALAVGLSPELLPAIISITLARGARTMAQSGVLVRRLESIENLGSMNMLCTDKTGTLTEGVVHLDASLDVGGESSPRIYLWARLNASMQTGLQNPLDEAIVLAENAPPSSSLYSKVDEIPYDFVRKRLSVVVRKDGDPDGDLLICKGAVENVLAVCSSILDGDAPTAFTDAARQAIDEKFRSWSGGGYRVLGLAVRKIARSQACGRQDEKGLCFAGFLLFLDPPKAGISESLKVLAKRGIGLKMLTGDNRHVAVHLANTIGLSSSRILTGGELSKMTRDSLFARAPDIDLFVEIDPNQKERVIEALRRAGHVVGYLGDGINDAPALHEADVGISVDGAVDVAREAADIVLLKRDLNVLLRGIDDGRRSFANTMKYISITTSANFGNMISMAFASMFLPFLPLLAKQILLNNLLSDVPALAIAGDRVDREEMRSPRRWDIRYVRRFMVSFGLVSSLFDFVTFAALVLLVKAEPATFQTAWFIESLLTELAIVLIVRTRSFFWRSRPGRMLPFLTLTTAIAAVALPYSPFAGYFGFVPLPWPLMTGLLLITVTYLLASELTKHWFTRWDSRLHRRSYDPAARASRRALRRPDSA
ncbi:putative magnesium-translocating P-type ATPase (plasmid) [Sinorhizobium fredii HH103]|uniref:magnesium-translocating P-type ATPase n=1 Tax=Rhizobium fredii TaxID=380 RepID=UPI00024186F8|nr:magnesium-translocating P-type ATPase [Sinorhizobium fredii]CCE99127.1 K01531 Mg2+-importing ATPase [Sinorhizobium fredii HH103]CEO91813.1 putative magnesium-translocating P-type ATPase [Sinorhizobium fredii HH103]